MLVAMTIQLEALNDRRFLADSALSIHGLFFKILEGVNPILSEELHNLDQLKPYTLSSLREAGKPYRTQGVLKGKLYNFRITILNEDVFNGFYKGLGAYYTEEINLKIGGANFKLTDISIDEHTTFKEIIEGRSCLDKRFKTSFVSPTSFRKLGKNYIFPDPVHLFKSYVEKWNSFAPASMSITNEELELIQNLCFATQAELKTELTNMNKYKIVGFRGVCSYQLDKTIPKEIQVKLGWLLAFVPFCGTGYKTTMGMGQTQVVLE